MNMKKYLAVAIILLFIGLAVAPSINANMSKEELVEFTTEVCGLNGGKKIVRLTQKEAEEVEYLFNSIRERLNATDTREEAEEVFKEAVVELDKYGLLGGLSVKQAQRLVIGCYNNPRLMKLYELFQSRFKKYLDENENLFCLICGVTKSEDFFFSSLLTTCLFSFITYIDHIIFLIWGLSELLIFWGGLILAMLPILIFVLEFDFLNPFCLGRFIFSWGTFNGHAEGTISTLGINGLKTWYGKIRPGITNKLFVMGNLYAIGFTGLKIQIMDNLDNGNYTQIFSLFLGHSLYVKINPY